MERLPDENGRTRWREHNRRRTLTFEIVTADAPNLLVTRIAGVGELEKIFVNHFQCSKRSVGVRFVPKVLRLRAEPETWGEGVGIKQGNLFLSTRAMACLLECFC